MAGTGALVVPEFPVRELQGLVKGERGQIAPLVEVIHDGLRRLGELGIEQLHDIVELLHETLGEGLAMAFQAHQAHDLATALGRHHRFHLGQAAVQLRDFLTPLGHGCPRGDPQLTPILQQHQILALGHGRIEGPGIAHAHVVGRGQLAGRPHVTGGAGRCRRVVLASDPLGCIQVHAMPLGREEHAVLGGRENFRVGGVGPGMAARAGLRLPGLGLGEEVPAMTGRAGAPGAIRVDSANAGIGPGIRVQGAIPLHLDLGAVTLVAACGLHRHPGQVVGQGRNAVLNEAVGLGMDRTLLVPEFGLVTARAILGRHDGGDDLALVLDGVRFRRLGLMTVHAIDPGLGMSALPPLLGQPRRGLGMAVHALLAHRIAPVTGIQGHLGRHQGLRKPE